MAEYVCGTDKQGNLRIVKVPASMTTDDVRDLVEWALEPPYAIASPITLTEIKELANENRGGTRG